MDDIKVYNFSCPEVLPPVGNKLNCKPVLIQSLHATFYHPELPTIQSFHEEVYLSLITKVGPDEPPLFKMQEEGYYFYKRNKSSYRRTPDGKLVERLYPDETDYATTLGWGCFTSAFEFKIGHKVAISLGIDTNENLYVTPHPYHNILVYTPDRTPLANFKVLGQPRLSYLLRDGTMCVVTDNLMWEKKRKNILRVYRLELMGR